MRNNELMVSICCLAYNHEKFIRQALDGFIMQQTNFPFEIVIHDDASTDNTAKIIKEYESKYPHLFNAIYQTENQRSKFKSGMNPRFNYPRAKGKYIALCDGDDYWTDPLKLQKQVDFLDTHKDYSGSFHNCNIVYLEKKLREKTFPDLTNHTIMFNDVLKDWLIPTASFVFRKDVLNNLSHTYAKLQSGDRLIHLLVANEGFIKFEHNIWSVYRIHDKSITETNQNFHNLNGQKNYLKLLISILPNLKAENKLLTRKQISILSRFIHNNSNFPEKLVYKLISIKHNSDLNWKGKILALIHKP